MDVAQPNVPKSFGQVIEEIDDLLEDFDIDLDGKTVEIGMTIMELFIPLEFQPSDNYLKILNRITELFTGSGEPLLIGLLAQYIRLNTRSDREILSLLNETNRNSLALALSNLSREFDDDVEFVPEIFDMRSDAIYLLGRLICGNYSTLTRNNAYDSLLTFLINTSNDNLRVQINTILRMSVREIIRIAGELRSEVNELKRKSETDLKEG